MMKCSDDLDGLLGMVHKAANKEMLMTWQLGDGGFFQVDFPGFFFVMNGGAQVI